MTIASKLETINEALGDIKSSIVAKGVTPTGDITTYSTAIDNISGGGDEITATNTTGSAISADDRVWIETQNTDPVTYNIIPSKLVTSTSFTGVAQEAIANNATGSVKTLLDGNGSYAPTTATKSITTNGTYTASAENAYGLSEVTVNVPTPDVWYNWKSDATANTNLTTYQSLGDRGSRIAYGNGTYVVISSQDNYFSYSTDNGQTWTRSKTSTGTMRLWNGLVYGNGKFVAVTGTYAGDYNIGAVSSDGINWTEVTLSASKQWNDIAYGNGKFVAVASFGSNNICTTSSDGVTWTSHTLPRKAYWWSIIFDGTQFVTIGTSGGSTYIATSSDGDTWAEKSSIASSCYTICYGNNKYIVSGGPTSFVSLDLENWTSYSTGSTSSWYFSAYGNGYYIGIPQDQYYSANPTKAYLSSDGEQWTEITLSSGYHWCDVIYENDKFTICSTGGVADLTISQSQCYTLTASPTTSTQVYEIPKKTSTLTITAVGTGTITLSDSKVYNRNSAGDVESPVLGTKTITSNDTYTAASDYLDGFSSVTVDVPSSSGVGIPREVSAQGVYQMPTSSFTFSLPSNATDIGDYGLSGAFQGCTALTSVDLSALTTVSGDSGFSTAFYGCTGLTSVSFPSLTTVLGDYAFSNTFRDCTGLTSVNFPSLTTVSGSYELSNAFNGCTNIESISFPSLTTTSFGSYKNQFNNMMANTGKTKTHKLHFPSNLQSTISGLTGYPLFGGTSGYVTCLFDLPATS